MISALILTMIVEVPVVAVLFRKPFVSVLMFVCALELVTHPVSMYFHFYRNVPILPVEVGVVCVEALAYVLYWRVSQKQAFGVSLVANTASLVTTLSVLHF